MDRRQSIPEHVDGRSDAGFGGAVDAPSAYRPKPGWRLLVSGRAGVRGRCECLHAVDGCPQRFFQRGDVPGDLSEEHAALESGEQEIGQPSGIRLGAEAAGFLHPPESVPEDVSPLPERVREFGADVEVCLDDLAGEGAEAASFLVGVLVGDVEVRPFTE